MQETTIERGSIVSLVVDEKEEIPKYVVYCVWKKVGSKRWPSKKSDNPSWPIKDSKRKLYRVGLREVTTYTGTAKGETNGFTYKCHDKVLDGVNVSKVYKIESDIANIKRLLLKVDLN